MGDVRAGLMASGAFLVLVSAVPYLLTIAQGRTRPRIFSWIVWTLLGAIATGAAYSEGAYASAALTAAATVETASIVALGWRYGNRDFERLDAWCLLGVLVGLGLWAAFDSPLVGLSAALAIDAVAAVPTVRHTWRKPQEEPATAYALCAVAALCTLAAVPHHTLVAVLYPGYLLAVNVLIAALGLRAPRPDTLSPPAPAASVAAHGRTSDVVPVPRAAAPCGRHAASRAAPPVGRPAAPALTHGRHAAQVTSVGMRVPRPRRAPEGRRVADLLTLD